ncbi:hypothetical protein ACFOUP_03285 [Belliella kenyensis]|uniref:Uncharacterized protein n=1 Tax=Belliella kenyensis TaxID=1472724 RepID=A0ABV8EGP8_9BACT|nr:hypothetical protein [Belliella kenyensis]MCH7402367.1 hypothetical protein [Belliella kenyensis]MDN3603559.1 hypothetical protein [Belliella kenyensis]
MKKSGFDEVESLLQDVGKKIELLMEKAAEAGGEVKIELEKKISELRGKQTNLEEELAKGKEKAEKIYQEQREALEPRFQESKIHLKNALEQLGLALESIFKKK